MMITDCKLRNETGSASRNLLEMSLLWLCAWLGGHLVKLFWDRSGGVGNTPMRSVDFFWEGSLVQLPCGCLSRLGTL